MVYEEFSRGGRIIFYMGRVRVGIGGMKISLRAGTTTLPGKGIHDLLVDNFGNSGGAAGRWRGRKG